MKYKHAFNHCEPTTRSLGDLASLGLSVYPPDQVHSAVTTDKACTFSSVYKSVNMDEVLGEKTDFKI